MRLYCQIPKRSSQEPQLSAQSWDSPRSSFTSKPTMICFPEPPSLSPLFEVLQRSKCHRHLFPGFVTSKCSLYNSPPSHQVEPQGEG